MKRLLAAVLFAATACASGPPPTPKLSSEEKERLINERLTAAGERRGEAITLLEKTLADHPGDEAAAGAELKLAEMLSEDAEHAQLEAMAAYDKFTEACRAKGTICEATPPKLDNTRADGFYHDIAEHHPAFAHRDTVLYLLGYSAHQAGRGDEAVKWLRLLVDGQPDSPLVPQAWMLLGEHYFSVDAKQARVAYDHVLEHPATQGYDLALFKAAWCDWKIGERQHAGARFKEVLDRATAAEKAGKPEDQQRAAQLREEALAALTLLFTEDEGVNADGVFAFLQSIGGDVYARDLLVRLGDLFFSQARYDRALAAYQLRTHLFPDDAAAPALALRSTEALLNLGQPTEAVGSARALVAAYAPGTAWAAQQKAGVAKQADVDIEAGLAALAQRLHGDAQADEARRRAPDVAIYLNAAELYQVYLARYSGQPRAAEMRFLRAEILYFKLGRNEEAGDEYVKVADGKGPRAKDALLKAIAAYQKARPATDGKLARATEAFASNYPKDAALPAVQLEQAELHADKGDDRAAAATFAKVVDEHPDDEAAGAAGDRLLETLSKRGDWEALEARAAQLEKVKAFQTPAEHARLEGVIVQAMAKRAEQLAAAGKLDDAAALYSKAGHEHAADARAPMALAAAAATQVKAGHPLDGAHTYLDVVTAHPTAPGAADAAFTAARLYEELAAFDDAVAAYGLVASRYPNDAHAADALYNQALLLRALGRGDEAVAADVEYTKRFPTRPDAEDAAMRVSIAWADGRNPAKAAAAFEDFARKHARSARAVEAHTRAARAWLELGRERQADTELAAALARWKSLSGAERDEQARWTAEARYQMGERAFAAYQAAELESAPAALKRSLDKKKALLDKAQNLYTDVVGYGDAEWAVSALLRIGEIYEQLGDQIRKLPPPPGLSDEERDLYTQTLDRYVVDLEDKAASIYGTGYEKALSAHVFTDATSKLRAGLGRLAERRYPPEREARLHGPRPRGAKVDEAPLRSRLASAHGADATAARLDLATAYLANGKPALAEVVLARVLVDDPRNARAVYAQGVAALATGKTQLALARFEKALALDGTLRDAHLDVGLIYLEAGAYAQAKTHLEAALAGVPEAEQLDVRVALGVAQRGAGAPADARVTWNAVLKVSPAMPDALYDLGVVEMDFLKDEDAARDHLTRFTVAAPAHPKANDARSRLKDLGPAPQPALPTSAPAAKKPRRRRRRRGLGLALGLGLLFAGGTANADHHKKKPTPTPAQPAAAAAAAPAPVPSPTPTSGPTGKLKTFDFEAMGIEGKVLAPQVMYLLGRIKVDLERTMLENRSFVPEVVQSVDDPGSGL